MNLHRLSALLAKQIIPACVAVAIVVASVAAINKNVAHAEESQQTPREKRLAEEAKKAPILPVVAIRPGESKELLLSTLCTVGVTRGGGLGVKEMIDGKPQYNDEYRTFTRDGLTIRVPGFEEATKTADLPDYQRLRKKGVAVFAVEFTATANAKPGVYEMHVNDSTCSGNCHSDFRVVVIGE